MRLLGGGVERLRDHGALAALRAGDDDVRGAERVVVAQHGKRLLVRRRVLRRVVVGLDREPRLEREELAVVVLPDHLDISTLPSGYVKLKSLSPISVILIPSFT